MGPYWRPDRDNGLRKIITRRLLALCKFVVCRFMLMSMQIMYMLIVEYCWMLQCPCEDLQSSGYIFDPFSIRTVGPSGSMYLYASTETLFSQGKRYSHPIYTNFFSIDLFQNWLNDFMTLPSGTSTIRSPMPRFQFAWLGELQMKLSWGAASLMKWLMINVWGVGKVVSTSSQGGPGSTSDHVYNPSVLGSL